MLSDIICIILAIYAILSPFWLIKAVKFGVSLANKPEEAAKEPFIALPKKKKTVEPDLSKEEQKIIDILANVDVFDGTSIGQKEIK